MGEVVVRHSIAIGEMRVSDDEHEVFLIRSLASCVAVVVFDETTRVGGVLRCVLPSSGIDPERVAERPHLFADTGVEGLITALEEHGVASEGLRATLVGGSNLMGEEDVFNLGNRISESVRSALQSRGVRVEREDVGGVVSRDFEFRMSDGQVTVTSSGVETVLN